VHSEYFKAWLLLAVVGEADILGPKIYSSQTLLLDFLHWEGVPQVLM